MWALSLGASLAPPQKPLPALRLQLQKAVGATDNSECVVKKRHVLELLQAMA